MAHIYINLFSSITTNIANCFFIGQNLKVVTNAAEKYHEALAENRKMFNEIQELKGTYVS